MISRKGLADEFDAQDEIVRAANEHKGDMLKRYRAQLAGQGYDKDAIKAEVEGFKAALKRRRAITKKGSEAVEHLSAIADEIYLEITAPSRTRVTREDHDPETGEAHDEPATEPQHSPAAQDGGAVSALKAQGRMENAAGVEPSSSTHSTPAERGQHDHGGQHVGREDDEQRDAARVSHSVGRGESADEGDQGQGAGASGTDRHLRAVSRTELGQDQDGRSGDVGGEARHQVDPEAKASTGNGATERGDVEGPADSVTGDASRPAIGRSMAATSDDGRDSPERRAPIIPFHTEETREQRTLRLKPHCQNPSACSGVGRDYCYGCRKAMSAGGDAA